MRAIMNVSKLSTCIWILHHDESILKYFNKCVFADWILVLASFENDKGVWADSINHAAAIYFFFFPGEKCSQAF